jgi:hypothetical protein
MEEAANHLLNFFGRFGCPQELLSDRGSQFVNGIIQSFLRLIGTKHILSLAFNKEDNSRVERANREVLRHLRGIAAHTKFIDNWHLKLSMVQRIMNGAKHSITGQTPADLIYGGAIRLDRNIFIESGTVEATESAAAPAGAPQVLLTEVRSETVSIDPTKVAEWAAERRLWQEQLLEATKEVQKKLDDEHLARVDPADCTTFAPDSYVLVMYPSSTVADRRPPTKLHSFWRGPLKVVSNIGDTYSLLDMVNDTIEQRHVTSIKQFNYDPAVTSPRQEALRDNQQWDIDRIVSHEGDFARKSSLLFTIKYLGYSDQYNRVCTWKELYQTIQLKDYLRSIGRIKVLPKNMRNSVPTVRAEAPR